MLSFSRVLFLLLAAPAAQASSSRRLEEETANIIDQETNIIWRRPSHPQISTCRCEAPWEHYYINEHSSNNTSTNSTDDGRRGLLQAGIDVDDFDIVNKVRVLPCDKYGNPIANMHSLVAAQENQVTEEPGERRARHQRRRRDFENIHEKGGGSSKSGRSSRSDRKPLPPTFPCPTPPTAPTRPTPRPPSSAMPPTARPPSTPSLQPTMTPPFEPITTPSSQPSTAPSESTSAPPSAAPSARPSSQILAEPTLTPNEQPTVAPSTSPSRVPTGNIFSDEPTPIPTLPPTRPPTRVPTLPAPRPPTQPPIRVPTLGPTPTRETCDIDFDLKCVTAMNMGCESLQAIRNLRCTMPTDLLTFTYSPRSCDADSNSQGPRADCETFDSYNPIRQARVDCAINGKRA